MVRNEGVGVSVGLINELHDLVGGAGSQPHVTATCVHHMCIVHNPSQQNVFALSFCSVSKPLLCCAWLRMCYPLPFLLLCVPLCLLCPLCLLSPGVRPGGAAESPQTAGAASSREAGSTASTHRQVNTQGCMTCLASPLNVSGCTWLYLTALLTVQLTTHTVCL